MKVAGYIRVSTNKEGQKESPENQKQLICKRQTLADSTKIYQASYRLTIYQKHWRFQS